MMEQLCFFPEVEQSKGLPEEMLEYMPGLIDKQVSDELLEKLYQKYAVETVYSKDVGEGIPDTTVDGMVRRCRHGPFGIG